jgi:chorismate mutase/prephenate dehydratase
MDESRSLDDIREDIDRVDRDLIDLLDARVGLAQEVGHIKGIDGKPFFTPERERAIFKKLGEAKTSSLHTQHLKRIFREIISAARDAEKPLTISYWGPPGTFSELAVYETFGRSIKPLPAATITECFQNVEHFKASYAVVPIENSFAGVVPETLDMFPRTNVKICAEQFLVIEHHLGSTASDLSQIQRIYAGPQPSSQCRRWIQTNLPNAEIVDVVPTSNAAKKALEDPNGAAIANKVCIERLGLGFLAEHIEDNSQNRTRFVVLGRNLPAKTGSDKTSLMFSLRNRPGELYEVLGAFNRHKVNLLMIESRPAQRAAFEYIFYADCVGHHEDENLQAALAEISERALEVVMLGSYPSSDPNLKEV